MAPMILETRVPARSRRNHESETENPRLQADGALVIYDAATFAEIKRLPMKKPSGKYNVHNKITRSAGTSH